MELNRWLLFAAFGCMGMGAALADPKPFDIAGVPLGMKWNSEFAYDHCPSESENNPDVTCWSDIELGGGKVQVLFHFHDSIVMGYSLSFPPALTDDLIEVFTKKFGKKPSKVKTFPVETRMGAKYTNKEALWITPYGVFDLNRYGDSIDTGTGVLLTPAYAKFIDERAKSQKQKLEGGL